MELKIGDVFWYKMPVTGEEVLLEVVQSEPMNCKKCWFEKNRKHCPEEYICGADIRSDHNAVVFVEVKADINYFKKLKRFWSKSHNNIFKILQLQQKLVTNLREQRHNKKVLDDTTKLQQQIKCEIYKLNKVLEKIMKQG